MTWTPRGWDPERYLTYLPVVPPFRPLVAVARNGRLVGGDVR